MDADQFITDAGGGIVPIVCHEDGTSCESGLCMRAKVLDGWQSVFKAAGRFRSHSFSFGRNESRFNRQGITTSSTVPSSWQLCIDVVHYSRMKRLPSPRFPAFYQAHHDLLHPSAWRLFYSDLPDSSYPLFGPRNPSAERSAIVLYRAVYTYKAANSQLSKIVTNLAFTYYFRSNDHKSSSRLPERTAIFCISCALL
ncbi:hypothetical protein N7539_006647 [Penicillium diatomitis]|uniref:Uncharacterized protein n=1 Tax=Penicillium diatomitis TaxID=2819901 RepID=A0A9W9X1K0_9EURO|nr:uncharacterized protein N7539_006647 [Penicillium diatomitis]KAJ5480753.1 hypothetical protein N7539_006647 [Penicillium diatomitis]